MDVQCVKFGLPREAGDDTIPIDDWAHCVNGNGGSGVKTRRVGPWSSLE